MFKTPETQSLESYLSQIEHQLRDLPSQARADEMREIEAHLRAMIEAGGDVAAVLTQFGAPRKVGRDLRLAWERKQPEAWWRAVAAPIASLIFQAFAILLFIAVSPVIQSWEDQIRRVLPWTIAEFSLWGFVYILLAPFCLSSYCLISGLIIGAISPKRGKWSIAAYFLSILLFISSAYLGRGISAYDNSSGESFSVIWWIIGVHILSTLLCLYGAHLGAQFIQKRKARIANAN